MIVIKSTISTSNGRRRLPDPVARGVNVTLAAHELDWLVQRYDAAAVEAAKAGAHQAAESAAWRAACLRRRPAR